MEFQPYKANECFENLYYKVPIELFLNPIYSLKLNSDSKLLYGFLLNRLDLSIKNKWLDENGNAYLIYARKDIEKLLNASDKTVTKAFKELSDCKLIYEKKQGRGKPNLIYVGKIVHMENMDIRKKRLIQIVRLRKKKTKRRVVSVKSWRNS